MTHARGEVTTGMVDLNQVSLAELRSSDDPVLVRSLAVVVGRMECHRTEVLQNQAPERI
jgi:hypothetical protein